VFRARRNTAPDNYGQSCSQRRGKLRQYLPILIFVGVATVPAWGGAAFVFTVGWYWGRAARPKKLSYEAAEAFDDSAWLPMSAITGRHHLRVDLEIAFSPLGGIVNITGYF